MHEVPPPRSNAASIREGDEMPLGSVHGRDAERWPRLTLQQRVDCVRAIAEHAGDRERPA